MFHGFSRWDFVRIQPAPDVRLRRGSAGTDGPEEAKENDIQPRVREAVEDAQAETFGRSDGAAEPAEEGEQPDPDILDPHHTASFDRGGRELCPQDSDGGARQQAAVSQ